MSADELKTLGRRITDELFSQGDLAVADELFAAGFVEHRAGQADAIGPESVKRFVSELRRAFPDLYGSLEDQVVDGDTLVQRITMTGTHAGRWIGVAATGRRVTVGVVEIARVGPDGKVAEAWSFTDGLEMLRQFGVGEPPGPPTGGTP
jgi:predicted ester cyclase